MNFPRNRIQVSSTTILMSVALFLLTVFSSHPAMAEYILESEGFELSVPPPGWIEVNSSGNSSWQQDGTRADEGSYSAVVRFGPPGEMQDHWLIAGPFDTRGGHSNLFCRVFESGDFWDLYGFKHEVLVSRTTPAIDQFTPVLTMTPLDHQLGSAWQVLDVDLGILIDEPTVYVAFRYQGMNADDWYLDYAVFYQPSVFDAHAEAFFPPLLPVKPGANVDVDLVVRNLGVQATGPFDVNFIVKDEGETEVVSLTESAPDILSGETATVTASFPAPTQGHYTLEARTSLPGDEDPGNDSASGTLAVNTQSMRSIYVGAFGHGDPASDPARLSYHTFMNDNENEASGLTILDAYHGGPLYDASHSFVWPLFFDHPSGSSPMYDLNNVVEKGEPGGAPVIDYDAALQELKAQAAGAASPLNVLSHYLYDSSSELGRFCVIVDKREALEPGTTSRLYINVTENDPLTYSYDRLHRYTPASMGQVINNDPGVELFEHEFTYDPTWDHDNLRVTAYVTRELPGGATRVVNSLDRRLTREGGWPYLRERFERGPYPPEGWTLNAVGEPIPWRRGPDPVYSYECRTRVPTGTSGDAQVQVTRDVDITGEDQAVISFDLSADDWSGADKQLRVLASTTGQTYPGDFSVARVVTPLSDPEVAVGTRLSIPYTPPGGATTLWVALEYTGDAEPGDTYVNVDDIVIESDEAVAARMTRTADIELVRLEVPDAPILTVGPALPFPVRVRNASEPGLTPPPLDFEVQFLLVDETNTVVFSDVKPVTGLPAGSEADLVFSPPNQPPGYYRAEAGIVHFPDQDAFNDRASVPVEYWPFEQNPFSHAIVNQGDADSDLLRTAIDGETSVWTSLLPIVQAHTDQPNPDALFAADPTLHQFFHTMNFCGEESMAPGFWVDLITGESILLNNKSTDWNAVVDAWVARAGTTGSPMTLSSSFFWFVPETSGQIWVDVQLDHQLRNDREYYLYSTITEDDADGLGFNHVPRILYPDVNGRVVANYPGFFQHVFSFSLDPAWKFEDLRLVSWVVEKSPDGLEKVIQSHSRFVTDTPSAVGEVPSRTALTGVHPNPFNPRTTVSFELGVRERTRIAVYDLGGRLVAVLADRDFPAGSHDLVWSGRDHNDQTVAAGVYLVRMEAETVTETMRMTLVK